MRPKHSGQSKASAERVVKDIRRATRRHFSAEDKIRIIRIVEQSHLPAKLTLDKLGVGRRTFYRCYDRYLEGGPEALADRPSTPSRVWNRIPPAIHDQIIELALDQSELSARELAVRFTDERRYFVSEATVYRLLKAHDLITSPAIGHASNPVKEWRLCGTLFAKFNVWKVSANGHRHCDGIGRHSGLDM